MGELHTIEVRHLYIEEEQVGPMFLDGVDGLDGVGKRTQKMKVRGLGNKRLQEFHGQRLVVNDDTTQCHLSFSIFNIQCSIFNTILT